MSLSFDIGGRFESFINEFTDEDGNLKYRERIREMPRQGTRSLYISYNDLLHQDPRLAEEVLANPEECVYEGEKILLNILTQLDPQFVERHYQFHLRIDNLTDKVLLRTLKTEHLGYLTRFEGIVIGVTETKPLLIEGHFRCASCGTENQIAEFPEGLYSPPYQCRNEHCQRKGSLILQLEYSRFIDWQKITIQEKPEELPPGQLPQSIMIHILDDLVDQARPGDRVEVVGILKARATRMFKRGQLATYSKFFHGVSISKETTEYVDVKITEEDREKIKELAESPYIIEKIRDSLAPSIYGHNDVKEGIACLLFGGAQKVTPDGIKIRGESNILLIGDPGVGKSQLLKFITNLAPRALYTTGKGSTAAGLCVSGESEVFLSKNILPISSIVDNEMENGGIIQYNENIEYKEVSNSINAFHSKNLKLESQPISRVWKIKSPEKLVRIKTKSGKELKLTGQTSLLSIDNFKGLIWKPANSLSVKDKVACPRKLPISTYSQVPNVYDLLKDYPKDIIIYNLTEIVERIIEEIKVKLGISNLTLTKRLKIHQDTLYRWKSKKRKGGVPLNKFEELCHILNEPVLDFLPDNLILSVKKGQYINLPIKLSNDWFYIMGLIIGDGRITKDRRIDGYGGVTIGFSNREKSLLRIFQDYFEHMGLKVNKTPDSKKRPSECRIFSSIIFHMLSKFGLSPSPKSNRIELSNDILFFPDEYIYSLIRGLYDSDGWIFVRDKGSSQIGFSSTSQALIRFTQNSLLKLGIIGYIRIKDPKKAVRADGSLIQSNFARYELVFNAFSDFVTFKKHIGFNHPYKQRKLVAYCLSKKLTHRNDDNLPGTRTLLNEIFNFYNIHSRNVFGYKGALSPSQGSKNLSRPILKKVLSNTRFKWHNHRVIIPDTLRENINEILVNKFSLNERTKAFKISKTDLYEFFGRRNRKVRIPLGVLISTQKLVSKFLSAEKNKILGDLIKLKKLKHEDYKSKLLFLKKLSNSDIFWDEIIEKEIIPPKSEFVYDLSVPTTHNFIVNGIIVHNTAAVIRDQDTGDITLEAGALVLADQGIAMVDEFDKMRPEDRTAIHEAMEQHTISIAKAGIVATLNARTSILAAANPKRGRWNPYKATAENLNLPPTILSRFDLIFVLEDKPNLKEDHDKASHILRIHKLRTLPVDPPIDQNLLRKYIAFARQEIKPRLSDEAEARLLEYYTELRSSSGKVEEGRPDPIAITPRQLEALVRLSEARAKMRLSDIVSYEDASGGINLLNSTLEKLATDAETGKFDIDKYSSGMSDQGRRRLDRIDSLIDHMLKESESGEPVSINAILEQAVEDGLDKSQVEKAITLMIRTGKLFEPQPGRVQKI
ncbi:MAG: LAGLIDADG family homing endonuclease [Candidatus Hodarchaeales archaeon]|jgi:replicative DNA helicase Mcm